MGILSSAFGQEKFGGIRQYIHVSSGGLSPNQAIPVHPNYPVALAHKVGSALSLPVIAGG
jgi:2,4-dienoyl-CoA reductase-like NADH-dependent reductase (Old Yellow Enzyme family)